MERVWPLTLVTVLQVTLVLAVQPCAPRPVPMEEHVCAGTCVSAHLAGRGLAVTQLCVSCPVLTVVAVWVRRPAIARRTTPALSASHLCAHQPVRTEGGV